MKINARSAKVAITYFRSKPLRILFAILWAVFVYQIISAGFSSDPFSRYDSSGSSAHLYPMDSTAQSETPDSPAAPTRSPFQSTMDYPHITPPPCRQACPDSIRPLATR